MASASPTFNGYNTDGFFDERIGEEIVLPNVPTCICSEADDLKYVLEHLDEWVVKADDESGGYGMLISPQATKLQRAGFARRIQ